ncbi:protein TolR [Endozoicomonas numazuensis]|uniref:Tol-Pal system protein TolR n=1 Tax=Endozoicomonas numazuensis TaxID=1137799 RepID=A0A081NE21_9GAMM|nr:protein TolR [Endozoicomonas numazuensis]KEQ16694.1 biopolymer transporter TolR [Endozoicomonas numazuensis]
MARSRTRRKPMSEINMVPFIDIMMVMLVAFMVSAPMLTQGVKVELPKTTSKPMPLPDDAKTLIISIQSDGKYFIDLGGDQESAKGMDDISEKVGKVLSASPQTQVLIKGDRAVNYGSVIELMARLQEAGVNDVGLITDPASLDEGAKR